jgi:glycerate-2-kinase
VQPDAAVAKALQGKDFGAGRIVLLAIGKASWQMASAALKILAGKIDRGLVITKYGHSQGTLPNLEICEAGHPVPDANSFMATEKAMQLVQGLTAQIQSSCLLVVGVRLCSKNRFCLWQKYRPLRKNFWLVALILLK